MSTQLRIIANAPVSLAPDAHHPAAAGATLPARAAVEVGLGPPPDEHHVITWTAHDALPGGRKGELFGYDIHYGSVAPTGGDNATRLVAGCCFSDDTTLAHRFNPAGSDVNLAVDYVRVYKPTP